MVIWEFILILYQFARKSYFSVFTTAYMQAVD